MSDNGTFVGLTEDEMDESLRNLRVMAASLGCNVEIIRMVVVGDCEWQETSIPSFGPGTLPSNPSETLPSGSNLSTTNSQTLHRQAKLWVAEALITPNLGPREQYAHARTGLRAEMRHSIPSPVKSENSLAQNPEREYEATEQLRITLTGPTTSGKSSLLGTLSTATLDNGRGKSRLSLLKHRHEIASGVTSSVAQELIGYKDSDVVNYASGNVTSWTDIHFSSKGGRLVLVADSPGQPRYRRGIVRGLIGWVPHWIVLCIDGSTGGTAPSRDPIGVDLAKAHLELALKLEKPLTVVITKLDLASKTSLRLTLSKILSIVKSTGRVPSILPPDRASNIKESDLNTIPPSK